MPTVQKSIRIKDDVLKEIEQLAEHSGRDFSSVANELLEEAIRMQRCPGIVFSEGTTGRRARVGGTGTEVWEVIATYGSVGRDFGRLRAAYHWMTENQLKSAVAYDALYPEEIDALIKRNEELDGETTYRRLPFLKRPRR